MELARILVLALEAYLACGLLFALGLVAGGLGRLDPGARTGTWGFRVLVVPGCAALWPLLLWRLLRAPRGAR